MSCASLEKEKKKAADQYVPAVKNTRILRWWIQILGFSNYSLSRPIYHSGFDRPFHNSNNRLTSARHAGLKDPAPNHDAGGIQTRCNLKKTGFRIKPGMTPGISGRLGWSQSIMLGFVPQPNLRISDIYAVMVAEGETQRQLCSFSINSPFSIS